MRTLNLLKGFAREEDGAVLAEYGILLVLITLALVGTVLAFSGAITTAFESTTSILNAHNTGSS